jgi:hypothetical protein
VPSEQGDTYTYNYYPYPQQGGDFAIWAQAGATVGLLLFAAFQMHFIRRSTAATEKAANAARDNAEAARVAAEATSKQADAAVESAEIAKQSIALAEDAIHVDRPNLFVVNVGVVNLGKAIGPAQALGFKLRGFVGLKNYGNGAADIQDYIARIEFFDRATDLDPGSLYGPEDGQDLPHPFYAAGEEDGPKVRLQWDQWIEESRQQAILTNVVRTAVHGRFRYKGSARRIYICNFFWWCRFVDQNFSAQYERGPKELNTHD